MNVQNTGAIRRPKLTLPYGGRAISGSTQNKRTTSTLSIHELRRLVAHMVD